jgi:hypothetical protein
VELNRRWCFRDGDGYVTETLAQHLARVGVTGKEPIAFGNKPAVGYYVRLQASHVLQVSKASFDALTGVPDVCEEEGRASIAVRNAELRLERAEREWDLDKISKARADIEHAHAAHKAASHAKRAHEIPWAQRQAMRAAALHALLDERGIELSSRDSYQAGIGASRQLADPVQAAS